MKAIAFCSKPIALMPSLGSTNKTRPAKTTPISKIGSKLDLVGFALAISIISPPVTSSSCFSKNSFKTKNTTTMMKTAIISNLMMAKLLTANSVFKLSLY